MLNVVNHQVVQHPFWNPGNQFLCLFSVEIFIIDLEGLILFCLSEYKCRGAGSTRFVVALLVS